VEVKNIWLSVAMDPDHPQAKGVNELHAFAARQMRGLVESGQALSPEIELLASLYGVSNDEAEHLLIKTTPQANGIEPKYVHSGTKHNLELPPETAIHILAPEK